MIAASSLGASNATDAPPNAAGGKVAADGQARFGSVLAGLDHPAPGAAPPSGRDADDDKPHHKIRPPHRAEDPAALLALSGAVTATIATPAAAKGQAADPGTAFARAEPATAGGSPLATGGAAAATDARVPTPAEMIAALGQQAALPPQPKPPRVPADDAACAANGATADILAARGGSHGRIEPAAATADSGDADAGKPEDAPQSDLTMPSAPAVLPAAASGQPGSGEALAASGADRQLDLAKGHAWLDGLARDIASASDGSGTLHFQLSPPALGALHVAITRGDEGAAVHMTTATAAAQTILSDARPQLVAQARAHGLHISAAIVDLGTGQRWDQAGAGAAQTGQQGADGQPQRQPHAQTSAQSEPDFYHEARRVDSAPGESPAEGRRDDAGYA